MSGLCPYLRTDGNRLAKISKSGCRATAPGFNRGHEVEGQVLSGIGVQHCPDQLLRPGIVAVVEGGSRCRQPFLEAPRVRGTAVELAPTNLQVYSRPIHQCPFGWKTLQDHAKTFGCRLIGVPLQRFDALLK